MKLNERACMKPCNLLVRILGVKHKFSKSDMINCRELSFESFDYWPMRKIWSDTVVGMQMVVVNMKSIEIWRNDWLPKKWHLETYIKQPNLEDKLNTIVNALSREDFT